MSKPNPIAAISNKVKTTAKPAPIPVQWWDANVASVPGYGPTTQMLLNHAITLGRRVRAGKFKGYLLETGEFKEFISALVETAKAVRAFMSTPLEGQGDSEVLLIWPTGSATVKRLSMDKVEVEISTTSAPLLNRLMEVCQEHLSPAHTRQPVYLLGQSGSGLEIVEVGEAGAPFEKRNYEQEVIADYDLALSELASPNPKGRLTIILGSPGTGKTYLMRGLLHDADRALFLFIPSYLVEQVGGPMLTHCLLKARELLEPNEPLVIVVEEADRCLVKREGQANAAVEALLNMSEGVIGSALNLRVICTTNLAMDQIDEAVRRSGRMSCSIEVGLLTLERASEIYTRLSGLEANFSLAEGQEGIPLSNVYRYVINDKEIDSNSIEPDWDSPD
jgi:hypothetical protein